MILEFDHYNRLDCCLTRSFCGTAKLAGSFSLVRLSICYNVSLDLIKSEGVVKSFIGLISSIKEYLAFTVNFAMYMGTIKREQGVTYTEK